MTSTDPKPSSVSRNDNEPRAGTSPKPVSREQKFELLLACFHSEQMSISQLRAHMAEDPDFERYVLDRLGP